MQVLPTLRRFKYPNTLLLLLSVMIVDPADTVVATLVKISYLVSALYPEPVFPIDIDDIVPMIN